MRFKVVLMLFISMALVVFALQNTEVVSIKVWFWQIQRPLALVILLCLAFGILIGIALPTGKKQITSKQQNMNKKAELESIHEDAPENMLK